MRALLERLICAVCSGSVDPDDVSQVLLGLRSLTAPTPKTPPPKLELSR